MVTPTRLKVGLLLAALTAPACFDVTTHDAGPLIVDDFEDGNNTARAPEFGDWSCYTFNPRVPGQTDHTVSCSDPVLGDAGDRALLAQFTITDFPADGRQQRGGVAIITRARQGAVDFRTFGQIKVDVLVESNSLPNARVRVELGCESAVVTDAAPPPDPFLTNVGGIPVQPNTWMTLNLDPQTFGPGTQPTPPRIPDCLRAVDSIRIALDGELPDGQSATGSLRIDNLKLFDAPEP